MADKNNPQNQTDADREAKYINLLKKFRRKAILFIPFMVFVLICMVFLLAWSIFKLLETGKGNALGGDFFWPGVLLGTFYFYLLYLSIYIVCENLGDYFFCWRGWHIEDLFLKYFDQFNSATDQTQQTEDSDNPYEYSTTPEKTQDAILAGKIRKARIKYRKQRPVKIIFGLFIFTICYITWKVYRNYIGNDNNVDDVAPIISFFFGFMFSIMLGMTLSTIRMQIRLFIIMIKSFPIQDLLLKYYDLCNEAQIPEPVQTPAES